MKVKLLQSESKRFVVTKGHDRTLYVFESEKWKEFTSFLRSLPLENKNVRLFVRFFQGSALEVELNVDEEICIPDALWDFMTMGKEDPKVRVYSMEDYLKQKGGEDAVLKKELLKYQPQVIAAES